LLQQQDLHHTMRTVCTENQFSRSNRSSVQYSKNCLILTAVRVELLGLCTYVCKWSYGPSCPVDFPLNISLFIHSFVVARQVPKSINWIYMRIKRRKWLTNATWHVLACVSVFSGEKDSRVELSRADAKTFYERIARRLDAHLPSVCSAGVDRCASEHYWLDANLPTWTIGVVAATPRWAHHTHEILFRRLYRTIQTCVVWLPTVVKIII